MSSSTELRQVLRGAAARQVRRAPFDVNLEDEGAFRALALAPAGDAVVRLHPDDIATAGGDFARDLTILADPTVEPGGCIVEIGACTIDAQISTALDRVREALQ